MWTTLAGPISFATSDRQGASRTWRTSKGWNRWARADLTSPHRLAGTGWAACAERRTRGLEPTVVASRPGAVKSSATESLFRVSTAMSVSLQEYQGSDLECRLSFGSDPVESRHSRSDPCCAMLDGDRGQHGVHQERAGRLALAREHTRVGRDAQERPYRRPGKADERLTRLSRWTTMSRPSCDRWRDGPDGHFATSCACHDAA
jgi:hypothetical protein